MNTNNNLPPQGELKIYGCGGLGINIVSHFESAAGSVEPGHSKVFPCYIDTSRSNLNEDIDPERLFILEGVDGSGGIRSENHAEIAKTIKQILEIHRPTDFNVVVFSGSGGSGSVFAPLILRELLIRGHQAVGIVVGSDESVARARNTMNTLKSLDSIARDIQVPVVICYEHNQATIKRSVIDVACHHVIGTLSVLCSKQNRELDSKDIANWVNFSKATAVKPCLAFFEVYHTDEEVAKATQPVSIASLYETPDASPVPVVPEYSCIGYPRAAVTGFKATHFVVTLDGVSVIAKKMQSLIGELELQQKARVDRPALVDRAEPVTPDGLVL